MDTPRIYADLNKWEWVDGHRLISLYTHGTQQDLLQQGIVLQERCSLQFWMDDADDEGTPDPLHFTGVAHFDSQSGQWVAVVDAGSVHNASESRAAQTTVVVHGYNVQQEVSVTPRKVRHSPVP